jgi:hypothetical protein
MNSTLTVEAELSARFLVAISGACYTVEVFAVSSLPLKPLTDFRDTNLTQYHEHILYRHPPDSDKIAP